jgi:peptide/nickel transport system permease protein
MSELTLEAPLAARRVQRTRSTLRPGPLLAVTFLLLVIVAALVPQLFAHSDPLAIVPRDAFHPPSWSHWFGTDQSGRDIFSRVIYGTRQSLFIGLAATAIAMSIAIVLGLLGGLGGARMDRGVGWLLEVLFAFPSLILALLFVAIFGSGIGPLIVATGLGGAPGYARSQGAGTSAIAHHHSSAAAQCHAPADRDPDHGRRPGHRLGVGPELSRSRRTSAGARVGNHVVHGT